MSTVVDGWARLHSEGRTEAGWHLRQINPSANCEIFAGVHRPSGAPGLLLEAILDHVPPDLTIPRASGFAVETTILGGSAPRVRFALTLSDQAYAGLFGVLCDDVATAASAAPSGRGAVRAWIGRLHAWQMFMSRHGTGGLSEAAVVGLIGELLMLRDHVLSRTGIGAGLDMWVGPNGEPDDFTLPHGFLEVKTTARQSPEVLEISNAAQLDDQRGAIVLAHVQLRPDPQGTSLPQLVASIRSAVLEHAPERMFQFVTLLMSAGYLDEQADLYPVCYLHLQTEFYRIEGNFPRLRSPDLRLGVRNCRYTIELQACGSYSVPANAVHALIGDRDFDRRA